MGASSNLQEIHKYKMIRRHYVYLTGGLGNQLFQFAAALDATINTKSVMFFDSVIGKPRKTEGHPDLFHLILPSGFKIIEKEASVFIEKTAGYMLRSSIQPRGIEKVRAAKGLLRLLGAIALSSRYKFPLFVNLSDNVGYKNLRHGRSSIFLGYFQSYRYLSTSETRKMLMDLSPKTISAKLTSLMEKAQMEKPIFVHIRLKDYLLEPQFGTPTKEYYLAALKKLNASGRAIWIFSDDIKLAKAQLPIEFESQYYYVDDIQLNPAQLWHLMRHGHDYVIANSTFSWWSAMLALNQSCTVVAPDPWFAAMPEPKDLIPPNWIREKAFL